MCTWGFGELPPESFSDNPADYYLGETEIYNLDNLGAIAIDGLDYDFKNGDHAMMFGSTGGAVRANHACGLDSSSVECNYID